MPNSRQVTPEPSDDDSRNQPENDGVGAGAGAVGGRPRDENSLSFKHFLQPHSDVVPQPAPTRVRGTRGPLTGSVDLVDMTMGLPDFVQDHLVLESLASGENLDASQSRHHVQHGSSSLDLNVLNEILPEFGPSQRNPIRVSQGSSRRRSGQDSNASNGDHHGHGSVALPDFLSDGPMQLNNNDSSINNSPSSSSATRSARARAQFDNNISEEPVRGPSFESNDLRLEVERLRNELTEKNRRLSQLEAELSRTRSNSSSLEASLRTADSNLGDANKRASEAERQISFLNKEITRLRVGDGQLADRSASNSSMLSNGVESNQNKVDANLVLGIARSSETMIRQLMHQIDNLKKLTSPDTTDDSLANNATKNEHFN